ncbi:barstar family protein [Streptomyces sp. NPDC054958]
MTRPAHFALLGEDDDHEDEQLWALCEATENLFADPPAPVRRRYELLGCALEDPFEDGRNLLALQELDRHGEAHREGWYLQDVRILGSRPCARDLTLLDVTVEAVRAEDQARYPQRRPLSAGFLLTGAESEVLGRCRDLAEVVPPEDPPPHAVRLLGCTPYGPLRTLLEGGRKRRLSYRVLHALDADGARLALLGYPDIVGSEPSPRGPGLYDMTVHMDPVPPVAADIWPLWHAGRPAEPNGWARFDAAGRDHWLGIALEHQDREAADRAAGATYHLDGRDVTDEAGFLCALGEAMNGPGGYFGRNPSGVDDALRGRFGVTSPFTLVWHDHAVARRSLGTMPLTARPRSFSEILAHLREKGLTVVLA